MYEELLITHATELVTLSGPARSRLHGEMADLHIIPDGAVLIRDGLIASVGPTDEVKSFASPEATRINAEGCVVMPGFVDAHTHPVFAGTREDEYELHLQGIPYQEIASRGGGILSTVRKTRNAPEEQLLRMALPRAWSFLEHGTTSIEAKSGYGLTVEDEIKILRVIESMQNETPLDIVPTFLGAHEVPDEFRCSGSRDVNGYLRLIIDSMLPYIVAEGLAQYCDVFCETNVFDVASSRLLLEEARHLGLGIRIHADQFRLSGGARLASELKAISADHLEYIDDDGISMLAQAGVAATLLPGSVFHLGLTRYAPARKLIDAGVPVVIATDFNPGSSPTPSMQMILSLACTQMKMTPAEAVTASTINAAYSIGLGARVGSIEKGKQADLVIFACDSYKQIPYFYGINHVSMVIKAGSVVLEK